MGLVIPHRLRAAGAFEAVLPNVVSDAVGVLLAPCPPDLLRTYPVSPVMNAPRHDAPDGPIPLKPLAGPSTVEAE